MYPLTITLISLHPQHLAITILPFLWVWLFHILHVSDMIQYFAFSVWLTSLSTMPYVHHVVANGRISFFLVGEYYSIRYIFVCSIFWLLWIMLQWICRYIYISLQDSDFISFRVIPQSGLTGSCSRAIKLAYSFFWRISILVSTMTVSFVFPPTVY